MQLIVAGMKLIVPPQGQGPGVAGAICNVDFATPELPARVAGGLCPLHCGTTLCPHEIHPSECSHLGTSSMIKDMNPSASTSWVSPPRPLPAMSLGGTGQGRGASSLAAAAGPNTLVPKWLRITLRCVVLSCGFVYGVELCSDMLCCVVFLSTYITI